VADRLPEVLWVQGGSDQAAPRRICDDLGMGSILVLSEADVRQLLSLDDLAEALALALSALSEGAASVPPRIASFSRKGLLGAMPGYAPGLGLAAKLVSVFPDNSEVSLPAHQALVALFDESTGVPLAVMGGTYLTAIRTATTAAIAARALARSGSRSLAIVGAGAQGAAHLVALTGLLSPSEVRIVSRHASKASELAETHPDAVAVSSVEEAVRGADVVCCCTDAAGAVLEEGWIGPGVHVGSVGTGAELPLGLLVRARLFVESRTTTTAPPPAGALELRGWDPSSLTEVGDVLAGRSAGRMSSEDVTVFKSTGHAVEDIAAGAVVFRRALAGGVGTTVTMSE
jgi:ornithine cyclodeaminase/alanine dehydrogenase-like protein (mu-crystallin family)